LPRLNRQNKSTEFEATAARLSELTGQSVSQVQKQLQKLLKADVIERKKALNVQGRGLAFRLAVKHTEKTKRLLDAIGKAAGGRRR
jgi:predicted transcriptional regulator